VPGFSDGVHRVGTDIQPGRYMAPESELGCYWARLSGFGGSLEEILANGNPVGQAIVEVAPTDAGFESNTCGRWEVYRALPEPLTTFGDGTWAVNDHIAPGTYRSAGGEACYWARLSGFSGMLDHIVANGNPTGPTVVEIAAGDVGFESNGCGEWTP
jgi:hypothetical protein